VASWYDFAKAIMELGVVNCDIKPIETKDYPTPAKRPFYSLLNKGKIKEDFQIKIPYWRDSLKECMRKLKEKV
jgi:dTDP-4-dehydrorhamnose reductase